ncbi:MAG: hypothetical protein ACR2QC_04060 [Gammaproteobacteria bacterium]
MSDHKPTGASEGREPMGPLKDDRAYRAWDKEQRTWHNLWRGLLFFRKTNDRSLIIAALHWPHRCCWSWTFMVRYRKWWHRWEAIFLPRLMRHNNGGNLFLGPFSYSWQTYQIPSGRYEDAPDVRYFHDISDQVQ